MPDLDKEESAERRINQRGQGLEIFTPDQMLSRLSIPLAKLKSAGYSEKIVGYSLKVVRKIDLVNFSMNLLTRLILKIQVKILHWLI